MNSDIALVFTVGVLVILFAGDPDLMDAIIEYLRSKG